MKKNRATWFKKLTAIVFVSFGILSNVIQAETIVINFEQPALDVDPYHRPYVVAWLETPKRKGVTTISLWHGDAEWLKDLRQWWRKLGRTQDPQIDAVTSATRKPGDYQLQYTVDDIPAGEYVLCLEAAREAGGRDFVRQKIKLGSKLPQNYSLKGKIELGNIIINITP